MKTFLAIILTASFITLSSVSSSGAQVAPKPTPPPPPPTNNTQHGSIELTNSCPFVWVKKHHAGHVIMLKRKKCRKVQ